MNDTRNQKKDKNQHVQVFIRVRPLSDAEKNGKSGCIVEIPSQKEIVVYERPQDKHFKKFSFDRVFGADSKQTDVYNAVVSPLLEQVLAGYNCTVFAYGQTGSGKTFTMEGANNHPELHWQSDTDAGMIPRFSSHLFDQLKLLEAQEFTVQVSFLELYNEEIFDLLSSADAASKIRLYEDVAKKGAVIIHGLEEVTVTNKSDVYKILEKGSEKRRTAATLMNAHSSRSHTVFSVTVHIKENAAGGEELMKTGKLNLVDLAGSENVGRSGAIDRRAREAGSINQSLLTLGRVIIALVERASHIPYRESKLTRLLQESLGGRAKTSIIATVSPASINLEETLSTLDYVHRAKHIANKPEVNQKLSKKALLKEYTEEIEKLRKDLLATRERNGVYLAPEHYNEMQTTIEQQSKAIEEKLNHIKALEDTMQHKEKIFNELHMEFIAQQQNLEETKTTLNIVEDTLKNVSDRLVKTKCDRDERKYLVEKHQVGEAALVEQVHSLLATVDTALEDIDKLEKKVVRQAAVEQKNASVGKIFLSNVSERFEDIETDFSTHLGKLDEFHQSTKNAIDKEKTAHTDYINGLIGCVSSKLCNQVTSEIKNLGECVNDKYENQKGSIEESTRKSADALEENCSIITEALNHFPPAIQEALRNEMGERLQELNAHICERFQSIALDIKGAVSTAYNYRREECDRLMKSIDGLKVTFDSVLQKRRAAKEKQRTFAKMMNALSAEFNSLNDCQEESHTMAENDYSHVTDVCNNMSACARSNYDRNVAVGKHLEETMQNNLTSVRSDVSSRTEKIVALHTNALTKAEEVLDNLGSFFGGFRAALTDHKLSSEGDSAALQEEVGKHKSTILNVLCDLQRTVEEAGKKHTELLELHRSKASERFGVVSDKVLSEHMEMIDRHEKLRERIRQMRQELHKFFNEDMQHDVPTGTTPVRKTFSYSRQLPTTSPHDRILQRFRESRKLGEMSEEEDDTQLANNLPITAIANSTILPDTSMSLSRCNSSILSDITVIPKFEDIESCTDGSSSEDTLINPLSSCESLVVSCKSTPSSSGPLTETKKMPLRCTSNNIKTDVYNAVVSPLLEQVLAGYNCTVFAYGQTGTGKTFTMEGANNHPELHWQSDTEAGMIPRFSSHLFDQLKLLEAQEFTVQVSFLELYNEEIFDLLSSTDDVSKIRYSNSDASSGFNPLRYKLCFAHCKEFCVLIIL